MNGEYARREQLQINTELVFYSTLSVITHHLKNRLRALLYETRLAPIATLNRTEILLFSAYTLHDRIPISSRPSSRIPFQEVFTDCVYQSTESTSFIYSRLRRFTVSELCLLSSLLNTELILLHVKSHLPLFLSISCLQRIAEKGGHIHARRFMVVLQAYIRAITTYICKSRAVTVETDCSESFNSFETGSPTQILSIKKLDLPGLEFLTDQNRSGLQYLRDILTVLLDTPNPEDVSACNLHVSVSYYSPDTKLDLCSYNSNSLKREGLLFKYTVEFLSERYPTCTCTFILKFDRWEVSIRSRDWLPTHYEFDTNFGLPLPSFFTYDNKTDFSK